MSETRYMISDTAKQVEVEAHVLRYWEEELELTIARNEMGHRYYTRENVQLFKNIKELKEQGFQLKAIKMLLPELNKPEADNIDHILKLKDELNSKAFQESTVGNGVRLEDTEKSSRDYDLQIEKLQQELTERRGETGLVSSDLESIAYEGEAGSKMYEFQAIIGNIISQVIKDNNKELCQEISRNVSENLTKEMDYIMRMREEREEARFKRLDETIRTYQMSRRQVAAAKNIIKDKPKRRGFFKRKKEKE